MMWAIPTALVLITIAAFAIMAVYMERPKEDWGQIIGELPTAPWDGQTFEHPGMNYMGTGRHRRR